ncbi:MAG: hypothetical protein JF606_26050 [Burkholderiales bacterium]|nr:hypothetical protein [Burkholderiales bacterium]
MLPDLNATVPGSPQPEMHARPPRSPSADLVWPDAIASRDNLQVPADALAPDDILAEFGISAPPQPADVFRLVDLAVQRPDLESRIEIAADMLLSLLDNTPELRQEIESRYGLSPVSDQVVTYMLDELDDDEIDGLEADLAQQHDPLGSEIQASVQLTGKPIDSVHAFDDEDDAASFARLRVPDPHGTSGTPEMHASPPRSPSADLLVWPAAVTSRTNLQVPADALAPDDILAEFGIPAPPQQADVFRLVDLAVQRPDLEFRIKMAAEMLVSLLDNTPELRQEIESLYGLSPVSDRVVTHMLHYFDDDEINGLEADLAQQHDPLGSEIQAWVHLTGKPIESVDAFDDEDNAASFARLLARLRVPDPHGTSATPEQTAAQVSFVIHAIANDADLRTQVFSLAEDALGSCGDNLAEGFSKIRLAVDNHWMARAVESGQVNAKQLNDWAGSLFRMSLLESAVHRFIDTQLQRFDLPELERNALTDEPLETMVHAKVALRQSLQLPVSTTSAMRFRRCSVLGQRELNMLAQEVRAQAADAQERGKFLLGHETWRTGMKALYAQEFTGLTKKQSKDPFYSLYPPPDLEGQAQYAEEARRFEAKCADEENALLLHLAAEGGQELQEIQGSTA